MVAAKTYRPDLCRLFRDLARWTMNKIDNSISFNVSFNEETITESLLLKLAERTSSHNLKIRAWSKHEEGRGTKKTGGVPTGADWDFWIKDSTGAGISLRIQAKRLSDKGKYNGLNGVGQQIRDLRNNCGQAIPLYVFYNGSNHSWKKRHCGSLCNPRFREITVWGCSFAPVYGIPKIDKPAPDIIPLMRPWHCLVCGCLSGMSKTNSLPNQVGLLLKTIYAEESNGDDERFVNSPKLHFEPTRDAPEWVEYFKEGHENIERLEQYCFESGLGGVVILDQLEPQKISE